MSIPFHSSFTTPTPSAHAPTPLNRPTNVPKTSLEAKQSDSLRLRRKVTVYLDLQDMTEKNPRSKAILITSEMRGRLSYKV